MSDDGRITAASTALGQFMAGAAETVAAADAYDRGSGIVRVDCGSDDTVERVARALARSNGTEWDLLPDEDNGECVYRRDARAVLLALQEGEK